MTVRLGIIGCGAIGTMHAEMATGTTIAAFHDEKRERAERLAERHAGARAESSVDALLACDDVDAVVVCVPNHLHQGMAIQVLDAGKDLLLEKPMAMNVPECDEIIRVAAGTDRIVQLGFVCRYAPAVVAVREIIASGRLGELYHAKAILHRRRGIPGLGRWFTTKALSGGGVLIDLGVHLIDLVRHLAGSPAASRVSGTCTSRFGAPIDAYRFTEMWAGPPDPGGVFDVEDGAAALIRFEGGLTLDLSVSWAANLSETILPDGVILLGDRGGVYVNVWSDRIELATEQDGYLVDVRPQVGGEDAWTRGWQLQHRTFAANVRDRRPPEASLADGRSVQAILDAIYRSSESRREVDVA